MERLFFLVLSWRSLIISVPFAFLFSFPRFPITRSLLLPYTYVGYVEVTSCIFFCFVVCLFGRLFTRILPVPFARKDGGIGGLRGRLSGRVEFYSLLKESPKSIGVILRLHDDFLNMADDPLMEEIEGHLEPLGLDVRSEENVAALMYSTGKVCEGVGIP